LYLGVGVEGVVAQHIAVLALKTGEESVHIRMVEHVDRRGSRNTAFLLMPQTTDWSFQAVIVAIAAAESRSA
jgi:hypothetical protein